MRVISIATLSAVLILSAPATARNNAQTADEQQATKVSSDKKVCRTLTATGSRIGERKCLTRAQWKKVDEYK